jgi:heterodisulfide reductase subunit D
MELTSGQLRDDSFKFDILDKFLADIPEGSKLKTCIQCGSCSSSCSAAENISSTRRYIWRMLQMGLIDEVISTELFWHCTICSMCEIRCPRGIPLTEIITGLRERYNANKGPMQSMKQVASILNESKNITGDEPKNRMLWMENIQGITQPQRESLVKDKAKVVYFVGCVSSLFPQSYKIPQTLTRILFQAGIDFSLLGEEEWCCGYPLIAGGYGDYSIKEYALHNLEIVKSKGANTLILSCPTCYHVWKNEYPKLLGSQLDISVKHYVEYLHELVNSDNIKFKTEEVIVTYHDPCDLGRKSGITEPPRKLLNSLPGVRLQEMRFNREDSKCCGGGGNLEMLNPDLSFEIARKRVEEALETGAEYLLTTCQQCKRTLQNAARRMKARIKIYDCLEFLIERIMKK